MISVLRGKKGIFYILKVSNFYFHSSDTISTETIKNEAKGGKMIGMDRNRVQGLYLASTNLPYRERLNAGIVAAALGLNDQIRAADFTGSAKAGTTALISALEGVESRRSDSILVCTAECRLGKPASTQEMIFGDAGAAIAIGSPVSWRI